MCHYMTPIDKDSQFIKYEDMYLGLKVFNLIDSRNEINSFLYPNYKYQFTLCKKSNRLYLTEEPKQQRFMFSFLSKDFFKDSLLESIDRCITTKINGGFHIEPFPNINKSKAKYKFPSFYSNRYCRETLENYICIIGFDTPVFYDGDTISATKLIVLDDTDIEKLSKVPYFRSKDGKKIINTTHKLYKIATVIGVKNEKSKNS